MNPIQKIKRTKLGTAMDRGLREVVTIEARFGSDFQRTVAMRLLDEFLASWKGTIESHHKKNAITISK